jgi:hypothetical protein
MRPKRDTKLENRLRRFTILNTKRDTMRNTVTMLLVDIIMISYMYNIKKRNHYILD